jgi:ketosteroid isomerase-like protein
MGRIEGARAAIDALVAAYEERDVAAYLDLVAPEVIAVLPGERGVLRSREALEERLRRRRADGVSIEAIHVWDLEVVESGDESAVAAYALTMHLAGEVLPVRERETVVVATSADGPWQVTHLHRSRQPLDWSPPPPGAPRSPALAGSR